MRIISQDKMTNISYDESVIYIHARTDNQICVIAHVPDEDFPIGTYRNNEDAKYVVSLILKAFMCNHKYFNMPEAEKVSVIRKGLREQE